MSMQVLWRWLKPLQCAHVLSGCKVHFIPFWLLFSCRHPTFESYALHLCLCWSVHCLFFSSLSLSLSFFLFSFPRWQVYTTFHFCVCMPPSWKLALACEYIFHDIEVPRVFAWSMLWLNACVKYRTWCLCQWFAACRLAVTWHISAFWLNVVVLTMAAHIWHRCRRNLLCRKPSVVARS